MFHYVGQIACFIKQLAFLKSINRIISPTNLICAKFASCQRVMSNAEPNTLIHGHWGFGLIPVYDIWAANAKVVADAQYWEVNPIYQE